MDLNVNGTMYVLKHAARSGTRRRRFSSASPRSRPAAPIAGSAPAGLVGTMTMMKLAADELGPSWMQVNNAHPGPQSVQIWLCPSRVAGLTRTTPGARHYRGWVRSKTSRT